MTGEMIPDKPRKSAGGLAAALVAFQKELPTVTKDKTANMGTYSYKYTDLGSLTHQVTPLLTKHGLAFTVAPRVTANGYEAVGVLMHESGESIEGALPIFGKLQDMGSALTYARRYLFGCLTGVVTEDDDDGARAAKADPTANKDWDAIADTAESLTDPQEVMALWNSEQCGKAPKVIQDRIKAHGKQLRDEQGQGA